MCSSGELFNTQLRHLEKAEKRLESRHSEELDRLREQHSHELHRQEQETDRLREQHSHELQRLQQEFTASTARQDNHHSLNKSLLEER